MLVFRYSVKKKIIGVSRMSQFGKRSRMLIQLNSHAGDFYNWKHDKVNNLRKSI